MKSIKNILVPTDFSEDSLKALEFGQCMARPNNSLIHLLHIVEPDYLEKTPYGYESMARYRRSRVMEAEEDVRRFVAQISLRDTEVTEAILEGYAPERILSYCEEKKIDLVLMSTHGKGKSLQPMGRVAERILRNSRAEVLFIKTKTDSLSFSRRPSRGVWSETLAG